MHNPKWDKYREKPCPVCEKPHKKRGPYCCQACANKARPRYSEKVRENARKMGKESAATPAFLASKAMISQGITPPPSQDFAIEIPQFWDSADHLTHPSEWQSAEDW